MNAVYTAIYRDVHGEEKTEIENDGQTLRMVVRGVEFISKPFGSFDDFKPTSKSDAGLSSFRFDQFGSLIAVTLDFEMPLPVVTGTETIAAILNVTIDLEGAGTRAENNQDWADPKMVLMYKGQSYASNGGWGCFELELLQIQRQLPPNIYMKCCFNCAYSGYSPYGNGLWGMYCHRNRKEEYLQANNKPDWIKLNDTASESVQETYLCAEFDQWNGETGYRDGLSVNRLTVTEDRTTQTEKI